MPRIPRLLIQGEPAVYHVISRTALSGFPMGDIEKDYFVGLLQKLGSVYFVETLGYSVMGNHIHGIFRMHTGEKITDEEIRERFKIYYGPKNKRELTNGQIPTLREKWSSLSEFIKELKQSFTRWYNKNNNRKGTFWGERFKSLLAEEGDTLINLTCLCRLERRLIRHRITEKLFA